MLDDKTAFIGTFGESPKGLGLDRCGNDPAKFFVGRSPADRRRSFDLEAENALRAYVIEFDNKVIHRIAMALLLNGDARDETHLAGNALPAQK